MQVQGTATVKCIDRLTQTVPDGIVSIASVPHHCSTAHHATHTYWCQHSQHVCCTANERRVVTQIDCMSVCLTSPQLQAARDLDGDVLVMGISGYGYVWIRMAAADGI